AGVRPSNHGRAGSHHANGKTCRGGRKGASGDALGFKWRLTRHCNYLTFISVVAGPLLANPSKPVHRERPALVFSVTSEVAASASLQVAPPKPALPDPSAQPNDDFGALLDSNLPASPLPPSVTTAPPRSAASDNPP